MKRWLLRAIGLIIFAVILWRTDLQAVNAALQAAGWLPWLYNLALLALVVLFKSLRWQCLLRPLCRQPLRRAALDFGAAGYLAMVTPGRVGDLLRAQFVREDTGVPASAALGSVVLDRIFDLGLLAVIGTWGITTIALGPRLTVLFVFVALFLVVVAWLCARTNFIAWLFARLGRHVPQRYAALVAGGGAAFTGYFRLLTLRHFLLAALYTVLAYIVIFFQMYDLANRMGIPLTWWHTCFFVSIVTIVTILPISIAGVGTRDLLYILIFRQMGLSDAQAVAFAMTHFIISSLSSIIIGVAAWQIRAGITGTKSAITEDNKNSSENTQVRIQK